MTQTSPIALFSGLPDDADPAARYPVEHWYPPHCGHSGMAIDREGSWFHEGRPIVRPALVRLFARLLRREPDGRHVLVTPVEMLDIDVAEAPLIATELRSEGQGHDRSLAVRIGATGDWTVVDGAHPLLIEPGKPDHAPISARCRPARATGAAGLLCTGRTGAGGSSQSVRPLEPRHLFHARRDRGMILRARLAAALAAALDEPQMHDVFLYRDRPVPDGPFRPAAVLIPITDRPEPGMIFTQRSAGLRTHGGQVAFPGGRLDPEDADAVAAALRESEEEIGLPPGEVEVLGRSDIFRTGTGFAIEPIVGIIPPDLPLSPGAGEVDAIFEVPLDFCSIPLIAR